MKIIYFYIQFPVYLSNKMYVPLPSFLSIFYFESASDEFIHNILICPKTFVTKNTLDLLNTFPLQSLEEIIFIILWIIISLWRWEEKKKTALKSYSSFRWGPRRRQDGQVPRSSYSQEAQKPPTGSEVAW